MFKIVKKEITWGGRKLTLETGKVARQASGSVVVTYENTTVLCTAVSQKEPKEGIDFFPLTVNYQEKAFAAGKIPGGFFKREGRPSEKEVLTSRLIDRPIRPLFTEGFCNETQVICTVLSHDLENNPDIVAIVGASAALAISGVPFEGPIGGARVGFIDGKYALNPLPEELEKSDLDLVVAGTETSVLMVESQANVLTEEQMLGAVEFGHKEMQSVIKLIKELKDEAGKEDWKVEKQDYGKLPGRIKELGEDSLRKAYKETDKQKRTDKVSEAKKKILETLVKEIPEEEFNEANTNKLIKGLEKEIVRGDILKTKKRIDGRGEKDVRKIESEIGLLPRTHGSALFTRGETQALAVTTLGTAQDQQIIDALEGESKESFMLHYNFPPYSVGEASFLRSPGRREIGHGKLAYRALQAVLPADDFPYTIRIVSEVTESNGSSSMATVCGSSLSLMDAGVPLKAPVAGIAMGLIKEDKSYSIISDILGDEDHLGDMDFKVAGTTEGITALQMDIKISGITTEIMQKALEQAKEGRIYILKEMSKAIKESKSDISENAPQITTIKVDKEKIGEIIGPGGKMIREICETSGAKIDIEDDGTVKIAATSSEDSEKALQMVRDIVAEAEVGKIYEGKVTRLLDFGALVNIFGKTEGLVHISEIKNERIEKVSDAVKEGDQVKVKVLGLDRGKIRLSMKRVDQESGDDLSDQFDDDGLPPSSRPRRSGPPRGGDRGGNRRDGGGGGKRGGGGDSPSDGGKGKRRFF